MRWWALLVIFAPSCLLLGVVLVVALVEGVRSDKAAQQETSL
jgi:hypothetical protein